MQQRWRVVSPTAGAHRVVPEYVDVAIVGGGIVGLCTALSLARRGVSVALFEKGRLGGEQSTRSWGWCRQFGRDPRELPLAAKAMQLWRSADWQATAQGPFTPCGIVYLAGTASQAERYAGYLERHRPLPETARALTRTELHALLPGLRVPWLSALHMPGEGRADPDHAVAHIASLAEQSGARLFADCVARGFETVAGRVSAIVTEFGRIACSSIVVAAGAWSSLFCRAHGVALPQIKVVSSVLATEPVAAGPPACVFGDGFALGRQRNGGYLLGHGGRAELPLGPDVFRFARHYLAGLRKEWGFVKGYVRVRLNDTAIADWRDTLPWPLDAADPFERRRGLNPPHAPAILDDALARLRRAFPAFAHVRVRERWAGAIDVTPDALPVISAQPEIPGLVIGTGFSGHGFGLAPGAGEVLADLATGRTPDIDVTPFRLSRFFDGSRALPGSRF